MSYGYHTEILQACQDYGLVLGKTLIPYAGWETRGSALFNPKGSVNHHTAGPRYGELPSLATLLYGRSDLPGPLCNAAHSRSTTQRPGGAIHLLAAGRANHAGAGGNRGPFVGLVGNSSVWGLEVEHIGYASESVSAARWDIMYRWHAACCDVSGVSSITTGQHFEWTDRKIDFVKSLLPGGTDGFRRSVQKILDAPIILEVGDNMLLYKHGKVVRAVIDGFDIHVKNVAELNELRKAAKDPAHIADIPNTLVELRAKLASRAAAYKKLAG